MKNGSLSWIIRFPQFELSWTPAAGSLIGPFKLNNTVICQWHYDEAQRFFQTILDETGAFNCTTHGAPN